MENRFTMRQRYSVLNKIGANYARLIIYRIEAEIKGQPADGRLATRIERTKPKLDAFEKWLAFSRAQVSAKSPTGQALKYIAKYWAGLNLFVTDGRIEIDNNSVERTIRPIALNRKKTPCSQATRPVLKTGPCWPR